MALIGLYLLIASRMLFHHHNLSIMSIIRRVYHSPWLRDSTILTLSTYDSELTLINVIFMTRWNCLYIWKNILCKKGTLWLRWIYTLVMIDIIDCNDLETLVNGTDYFMWLYPSYYAFSCYFMCFERISDAHAREPLFYLFNLKKYYWKSKIQFFNNNMLNFEYFWCT